MITIRGCAPLAAVWLEIVGAVGERLGRRGQALMDRDLRGDRRVFLGDSLLMPRGHAWKKKRVLMARWLKTAPPKSGA